MMSISSLAFFIKSRREVKRESGQSEVKKKGS